MRVLMTGIVMDGFYSIYNGGSAGEDSRYAEYANGTLALEQGIYSILMDVAVYASAIAFIGAAILLYINSKVNSEKHTNAKSNIVKVMVISAFIWAVVSIVQLVYDAGIR